jgi:hypothetical protein
MNISYIFFLAFCLHFVAVCTMLLLLCKKVSVYKCVRASGVLYRLPFLLQLSRWVCCLCIIRGFMVYSPAAAAASHPTSQTPWWIIFFFQDREPSSYNFIWYGSIHIHTDTCTSAWAYKHCISILLNEQNKNKIKQYSIRLL